tara:strand:- start:164 stop:541 length:378 start_codon:yes stop_codon:yes gene_type:complete
MSNLLDLISRIFLSLVFLINGYSKITNIDGTIGWMEMYGLPGFFIYPAILLEFIAPILLIIGYQVRLMSVALGLFCLATAIIFLRDFADPMTLTNFLKNVALAGGFFILAINGPKEFSIDYRISK